MYCVYGNSSWYMDCCPLYSRCPLLGVSVIGGPTVVVDNRPSSQTRLHNHYSILNEVVSLNMQCQGLF